MAEWLPLKTVIKKFCEPDLPCKPEEPEKDKKKVNTHNILKVFWKIRNWYMIILMNCGCSKLANQLSLDQEPARKDITI